MPVYIYNCKQCDKEWEAFRPMASRHDETCKCGAKPDIVLRPGARPQVMEYFDVGLGVHITGPAHRRAVMKARGVHEAEKP